MAAETDRQSFWDHLDVLRAAIVKSLLVALPMWLLYEGAFGLWQQAVKRGNDKRIFAF